MRAEQQGGANAHVKSGLSTDFLLLRSNSLMVQISISKEAATHFTQNINAVKSKDHSSLQVNNEFVGRKRQKSQSCVDSGMKRNQNDWH